MSQMFGNQNKGELGSGVQVVIQQVWGSTWYTWDFWRTKIQEGWCPELCPQQELEPWEPYTCKVVPSVWCCTFVFSARVLNSGLLYGRALEQISLGSLTRPRKDLKIIYDSGALDHSTQPEQLAMWLGVYTLTTAWLPTPMLSNTTTQIWNKGKWNSEGTCHRVTPHPKHSRTRE